MSNKARFTDISAVLTQILPEQPFMNAVAELVSGEVPMRKEKKYNSKKLIFFFNSEKCNLFKITFIQMSTFTETIS